MSDDPYDMTGGVDTSPGDHRPNVYVEADKIVYRASSLGGCVRSLAAIRSGEPPAPFPAKFRKALDDGNRGEVTILQDLASRGFSVGHGSQNEVELVVGKSPCGRTIVIRGHIDDIADDLMNAERYVVECKTTTAKYGIAPHLQEKYDWQLSTYMHFYGLKGLWAIGTKDPETGDVVNVDIRTVETPKYSLAQIKARVRKIEAAAAKGILPECDTDNRYPCPTFRLCTPVEKPVTVRQDMGDDEIFDGLADEYDAARQDEAEAKAKKEDAKARLIAHLGGRVDKTTADWRLAWTGTGLRKKLDEKALAKFLAAHERTIDEFYGTTTADKSIKIERVEA